MKINYRKKVPCFGNEPMSDIELMRKMHIKQMEHDRLKGIAIHFSLYTSGAVVMGLIIRKIYHLFHN